MRLRDKVALITGGSRGIGRAVAVRFALEGASVAINHADDGDAAEEVLTEVRRIHREKHLDWAFGMTVKADVSQPSEVDVAFKQVLGSTRTIDIVVNNAGILGPAPAEQSDPELLKRVIEVNLLGAAHVSSAAVRHFLDAGARGVIINTSSVHERVPKPGFLAYSISKGGMGNLTRTMALEYARQGIRVNAVAPGAVITDMNASWKDDPKKRAAVESHIPMGYAAEPEDMTGAYVFLASDESSYVTGQTLYVCGGLTLYPEFMTNWSS